MAILALIQEYIITIILGIVILLVGFALGVFAKKFLHRLFEEIELNRVLRKLQIRGDFEKGTSILISYVIYVLTILFFLDYVGISSIVLYIGVASIGILLILTFLVGLKDVIPNFVAWALLQRRRFFRVGRRVEVKEISGVIEKIGLLETEIKTDKGDILYVPNTLFLKSKLKMR